MRQRDVGTRLQQTRLYNWLSAQGVNTQGILVESSGTLLLYPSAFPGLGHCYNLSSSTTDGENHFFFQQSHQYSLLHLSFVPGLLRLPFCIHPNHLSFGLRRGLVLFSNQGSSSQLGLCLSPFLAFFLSLLLSQSCPFPCVFNHCLSTGFWRQISIYHLHLLELFQESLFCPVEELVSVFFLLF